MIEFREIGEKSFGFLSLFVRRRGERVEEEDVVVVTK
jgi:hypothetical protein